MAKAATIANLNVSLMSLVFSIAMKRRLIQSILLNIRVTTSTYVDYRTMLSEVVLDIDYNCHQILLNPTKLTSLPVPPSFVFPLEKWIDKTIKFTLLKMPKSLWYKDEESFNPLIRSLELELFWRCN